METIFDYPRRQWTCPTIEEVAKISHSTAFRTLNKLRDLGILKSIKINKKNIIFELVHSPISTELKRILNMDSITTKKIAIGFIKKIKSNKIYSILLYGSSVKKTMKAHSDIDLLIILKESNKALENDIYNRASEMSSNLNKTISTTIINLKELTKEKNSQFINSIKNSMEVLYGKNPF